MHAIFADTRHALRRLRRNPGFALVAVATLTMGIAAVAVVFAVVNAYLLQPLPYARPAELVHIWQTDRKGGHDSLRASGPNFLDWQAASGAFAGLGAYNYGDYAVTLARREGESEGESEPARLRVTHVTPNLPALLGVNPLIGRLFERDEDQPGRSKVALVSHGFWRSRMDADPAAATRTIYLDGVAHQVVGVMPESFVFPMQACQIWVPLHVGPTERRALAGNLMVVARLNAGVSVAQAQAEMNAMQQRLERDHPQENAGSGARLVPLRESLLFFYDAVRASLLALLVAVGLVLLIVCANLGSLLMARAAARAREIAVRAALGAGRLRLLQQLLVENGILALAGGVGGALAAAATLRAMRSALPEDLFRAGPLAVDATVLVVAGLASLLAAAVFGLAPARLALAASQEALADGSRGQAGTRHGARFHRLLIVGQLALAMTLLAGTAVALETFYNLQRVSLGFEARQVLTAELQLPESRYPSVAERSQFYEELMRRMRSVAGVEQAATVYPLPLNFESLSKEFTVEGRAPSADKLSANAFWVSTDYFATMRIPLLKGRSFTVADHSAAPRVAIVNQKMAEQYWPGQDPVGRQIRLRGRGGEMQLTTVIGVAGASKSFLVSDDPHAQLFVPMLQEPTRRRFLMIRAGGRAEPLTLAGAVRAEVHALDKTLPVSNVRSMTQVVAESMQLWTLPAAVMAGLGLAALALAVMGIYGFLSYAVATRTREIGVRVALGARRADIVRLILGQGLRLAGIGLAGGLALAIGLSRLARSMLFGVAALDPFAFVLTPLALAAVAALACAAPAWRAARLAPLEALRYE